jgi:hypothetical protein
MSRKGEKEIDKRIADLNQQKKELLREEGKAYRCTGCDEIAMKSGIANESEREGLCYDCWSKKVQGIKREKLMQTFKDARIIDIVPEDNPYGDISEVEKIILEVDEKHYEVTVGGYEEHYIGIREKKG